MIDITKPRTRKEKYMALCAGIELYYVSYPTPKTAEELYWATRAGLSFDNIAINAKTRKDKYYMAMINSLSNSGAPGDVPVIIGPVPSEAGGGK